MLHESFSHHNALQMIIIAVVENDKMLRVHNVNGLNGSNK